MDLPISKNCINFHLKGGNLHSELLHIEASFNYGLHGEQSIRLLNCRWFNITKDKEVLEIEDVSGQFYQPSILDIDTKIMVQAWPNLNGYVYYGEPLTAETNFLQPDPKIFDLANQALNQGEMQLNCKLENIQTYANQSFPYFNLPLICTLIADEYGLMLKTDQNKIILKIDNYQLKIIKKSNNQFEIFNYNIKLLIALTNNIFRDAFFQFCKTLESKEPDLNDTAQLYVILSEIEQKITQKDNEISQFQEIKQKLTKNLNELQSSLQIQNKDIEILNQKQLIDKLDGKTQIYIQEIKALKSQVILLENTNKKLQLEIEELKKNQNQNQDEIREMLYREKVDSLQQQNESNIEEEDQQWQLINEQLMKEIEKLENNNTFILEEKEMIQNELNNYKKKYESLLQEIEINQKKEKSDMSSDYQVDVQLEAPIKKLKFDYDQDIQRLTNKHYQKSYTSQEIQVLQKLANSLTDSLSDQEQALQTQRNINRDLLGKLSEFTKRLEEQQN